MKTLGRGSLAWLLWTALSVLRIAVIGLAGLVVLLALIAAASYTGLLSNSPFPRAELVYPWYVTVLGFAVTAAGLLAAFVVIDRLRLIFGTLASGDPFVPENARHLRVIAVAIASFEVVRYAVGAGVAVLGSFTSQESERISGGVDLNPGAWIGILAIVVLAEVFHEGSRLRSEQKLTI